MLLNGAVLNGASLNGAPLIVAEGTASFGASGELSATATRTQFGTAAFDCSGELVADGRRGLSPTASLDCSADLSATAYQQHAGVASLDGTGGFIAFVERIVLAEAAIAGSAELFAVAQGFFVTSNVDASAELSVTAYRILPGVSSAVSSTGELSATAVAYRMPTAAFDCTGEVRAEPSIKLNGASIFTHYGFQAADATGDLSISADARVYKYPTASFDGSVEILASGHLISKISCTVEVSGEMAVTAVNTSTPGADFTTTAEMTATGIRIVNPAASAAGGAEFTGSTLQKHAGGTTFDPSAELAVDATRVQFGVSSLETNGELVNNNVYLFRLAEASFDAPAELVATARTNVEAFDPEERTMYRSFTDRDMRRPFEDREMYREAA